MLSKIIVITASITLMFASDGQKPLAAPSLNDSVLAKSAVMTSCIGPMTLQFMPKNRGVFLLAFGAGGCSASSQTNGFGLRFGKIASEAEAS